MLNWVINSNVMASPSLFLHFFRQLVLLCSYLIGGTIPTSLLVLVGNIFTPLYIYSIVDLNKWYIHVYCNLDCISIHYNSGIIL